MLLSTIGYVFLPEQHCTFENHYDVDIHISPRSCSVLLVRAILTALDSYQ